MALARVYLNFRSQWPAVAAGEWPLCLWSGCHPFLPMRTHFPLVIYQVLFFLHSDQQCVTKPLRKWNQVTP